VFSRLAPISPRIITPGDAAWDNARLAWNRAVDQRPAAIALPTSTREVVAAVNFARRNGLWVAAQSTGHSAGPLGSLACTCTTTISHKPVVSKIKTKGRHK